jgi:hypothetical protein
VNAVQLELFQEAEPAGELEKSWRKSLTGWPAEVWEWRHFRHTTGWSMAAGRYVFARILFASGRITKQEFKRWWRFHQRVMIWDKKGAA